MMESLEGTMMGIPSPETISTKLQRIATLAKQSPEMAFTSLAHNIDIDSSLRDASCEAAAGLRPGQCSCAKPTASLVRMGQ